MKALFLILILILSFLFISFFLSSHNFSNLNSEIDSLPEKIEEDVTPSLSFLEELPKLGANPICLSPTRNCQSTNTEIVNLAKQLTSGKSKLEGAKAIFNWCHSNIHYEEPMYFNTKYGALGTLQKKKGLKFHLKIHSYLNNFRKLLRWVSFDSCFDEGSRPSYDL